MGLNELWAALTAPTPKLEALSPGLWVAITLLGLAVAISPRVWEIIGYFTTLVHEAGHALAGLTAGRRITGISLQGSMAGHTMSVGKTQGFGLWWTTWWGYPAPALAAWGYLLAAVEGKATLALAITGTFLLLTLLLCRSLGAFAVVLAALLVGAIAFAYLPAVGLVALVYALGWHLLVGAIRGVGSLAAIEMLGARTTSEGDSDAAALARLTLLPRVLWLVSFGLAVGYFGYRSLELVWTHRPS